MVNDKAIEPHVPVWDKTQRTDGTLSSSDFRWDEQANEYRCPLGKALRSEWRPFKRPRTHITKVDTIIYASSQSDCVRCPFKARCCPHTPTRKIRRSIHEPARDVARAIAKSRLYKQSRKDRKKVEMLFAHLKRILKLDRLRLRGPSGAHDEFLLAAIATNGQAAMSIGTKTRLRSHIDAKLPSDYLKKPVKVTNNRKTTESDAFLQKIHRKSASLAPSFSTE
jgi:hypothetical protein